MYEDVNVSNVDRKLVIVSGKKYICDVVVIGENEVLCNGENLETGEKTGWITIKDTLNLAFSFGDYLKEYY